MDATHLHLILTHFPIVGTFIAVLILANGLYIDNEVVIKVSLITFISMAIITIPVYLTGEEAEHSLEQFSGISNILIHNHEDIAEKAIWLMGILGVVASATFFSIRNKLSHSRKLIFLTLTLGLVTFGIFTKVGYEGGKIRHSEIREISNEDQFFGEPVYNSQEHEYID